MSVNTWELDRQSVEWVGPFTITETVGGIDVAIAAANVRVMCLPLGTRPTGPADARWQAFDTEPGGTTLGYMTAAVDSGGRYGFWAKISDNPETPWRRPEQVGYLTRL